MPELILHNVWKPTTKPVTVLIRGDVEIHERFKCVFNEYNVSGIWEPSQEMYKYGFYVNNADESDITKFQKWLDKYKVPEPEPFVVQEDDYVKCYATSYHDGDIRDLVKRAKYHYHKESYAAEKLVSLLVDAVQQLPIFRETDYFVAVPYRNKNFDLPSYLTQQLCQQIQCKDGSSYVYQKRDKKISQKELDTLEEKHMNVKDLFATERNTPFSGKVVTIIDDLFRSGTTINELARVLHDTNPSRVQALVLTKTFRD